MSWEGEPKGRERRSKVSERKKRRVETRKLTFRFRCREDRASSAKGGHSERVAEPRRLRHCDRGKERSASARDEERKLKLTSQQCDPTREQQLHLQRHREHHEPDKDGKKVSESLWRREESENEQC